MKIKENHKLRKPSGAYAVGCSSFYYEYERDEQQDEKRLIPCLCFYPAAEARGGRLKKYISKEILPGTSGIETNSYMNVPVADGKHPLLLFSHGYCLSCEANTVQFEELASHGYIVLSIGHLGDGSYELPDGSISKFDVSGLPEAVVADATKGVEIFRTYAAWLGGEGKEASIEEHHDYYERIIDSQPNMIARNDLWVTDSLTALEHFLADAERENDAFYSHIDAERIGAVGMSFGGSAALNLAFVSERVKAIANLDGFCYSSMWHRPMNKPVLLLQNDSPLAGHYLRFPFQNAASEAYLATILNSTHSNFTDYSEIMAENLISKSEIGDEEVEIALLGTINPERMESVMNALLVDFFDKYLKGKAARVIDIEGSLEDVILQRK
ncbi:hypothetical protein ABEW34_04895 [Paenibacillus algorifonticola]|uniref:alpha/beta hydrolase family protein n=1 Tax=Paenibacillus algorifonticola TaxID=684063 RepID=UPI003D2A18CD